MAARRGGTVTIDEDVFQWITFTCLRGLNRRPNILTRFDDVKDRFGVYIFIHTNRVSYVGLAGESLNQRQSMKERIRQHFQHSLGSGATFWKNWCEKTNGNDQAGYRTHIADCRLETLSINPENPNHDVRESLPRVIKHIERFFILEYKPTYNLPYHLSEDQRNNLKTHLDGI